MKSREEEILHYKMTTADGRKVVDNAIRLLDHNQVLEVEYQLLAPAVAFLCLLEVANIKVSDVLGIAHQIAYDNGDEWKQQRLRGVKHFLKNEWKLN